MKARPVDEESEVALGSTDTSLNKYGLENLYEGRTAFESMQEPTHE